ncbi:hypothetical protein OG239_21975 [Streptomyces sp. NBC_00868]|uniref:hypothetical protein n=1 Tax=unclassified Streptomyces TaxID=2593676 RepID=UPI0032543D0B|nr:hypothetical protein OG239_21975 [Streptomyces sp. NBC_00868]
MRDTLDRFADLAGLTDPHALYRAGRTYPERTEWPDGDRLFRIGRLRRKDVVPDSDWGAVWSVMRTLTGLHGDEGVRLVVWFELTPPVTARGRVGIHAARAGKRQVVRNRRGATGSVAPLLSWALALPGGGCGI